MATKYPMVIDTDVGIDDAISLLLTLSQPTVDVIGVTCVHGNTTLDNVLVNTLRVLRISDRLDIPVYKGAESPLLGNQSPTRASYYHGADGLGGVPEPDPPSTDLIQSEHAVNAMIRMVNERPGEVSLVAIGPLTNLALAIKMDPGFGKKLKELVIMGGNVEGRGSKWPGAEFNFRMDPEAAQIVLQEYQCDILIMPWEACINNSASWDWYDNWIAVDSDKSRFVRAITEKATARIRGRRSGPLICDAAALAITINRSMITEMIKAHVLIELNGEVTRGQMVQVLTDRHAEFLPRKAREVDIVMKLDTDVFMTCL